MPVLNETRHAGEFVLSEANGQRSRDAGTIAAGQGKLPPGTVLGKITASGKFARTTMAAADGSQNAVAVLFNEIDATAADVSTTLMARDCEVNGSMLTYGADVDQPAEIAAKNAGLAAQGIIVR